MVIGEQPENIVEPYKADHRCEPYVKYKYLDAKKYQKASIKALEKLLEESDKIGISDDVAEHLKNRLKVLSDMSSFDYYRELTDGLYYDENGNALSDENPNKKFNTCRKGGNFSLPLILKDGNNAYQAYARDVDWERMNGLNSEVYTAAWEMVMENREPVTDEEKTIYESMKDKTAYFEKFKSKEEYVKRSSAYWNYAYLDENGWDSVDECESEIKWINEFYDKFINKLNGDELVTIYECSVQS